MRDQLLSGRTRQGTEFGRGLLVRYRSAMIRERRLGWALAGLGMLLISTDSLWVRLSEAGSWDMAFLVALLSLPIFLALNRAFESSGPRHSFRAASRPLLAVAALSAISHISFITAITRTDIANVVVIVAASPIVVAVIARLALGERATARVWVAIGVTGIGIGIVVAGSVGRPTLDGDLLALLAIGAFSANMVVWRRYSQLSRYVGLALSSLFVIMVSAPFAAPLSQQPRVYFAAAAMGLIFSPAGRIAHTTAPRFAPSTEVALFAPVETVAATLWAWLAFSEVPTRATVIGGLIIVGAVFYGTFGSPTRVRVRAEA